MYLSMNILSPLLRSHKIFVQGQPSTVRALSAFVSSFRSRVRVRATRFKDEWLFFFFFKFLKPDLCYEQYLPNTNTQPKRR